MQSLYGYTTKPPLRMISLSVCPTSADNDPVWLEAGRVYPFRLFFLGGEL